MVKSSKTLQRIVLLAGLTLLLAGCSSGDADPTGPGGGGDEDTTAPRVLQFMPADGTLVFDLFESVIILFDEDMDPDSADGNVTVSHGAIGDLSWIDPATLMVMPGGWPEATEITITAGTGLTDVAGNPLAAPVSSTIRTIAGQLALIGFSPDDGDVGVNRNASIGLGFTEPVMVSSLESGVTIGDGAKIDYAFDVTDLGDGNYHLDLVDFLPAETLITVTVGVDVMGDYTGTNLPAAETFSFTTGLDVDDTPPTIESITPAGGSVMPADQGAIVVRFSEAVDLADFSPPSMNGQFAWAFDQAGREPELSPDGTELTIFLPAELPAGLALEVVLSDYEDLFGNVQAAATAWSATVAGTASPFYLADGYRSTASGTWEEGELGNETPTTSADDHRFYEFVARAAADEWEHREYAWDYSELDYYEILSVTPSGISILGFGEDEGAGFEEFMLSNPLLVFDLPFTIGNTWTGSGTVTVPDGTLSITMDGEVVAQEDLTVPTMGGAQVTWTDAWHVTRNVTISVGGDVVESDQTGFWIVPGVGIVRENYYEENYDPLDSGWYRYDVWLDVGVSAR